MIDEVLMTIDVKSMFNITHVYGITPGYINYVIDLRVFFLKETLAMVS